MEKNQKTHEFEEILEISQEFFPFGLEKVEICGEFGGDCVKIEKNLVKILKKSKGKSSIQLLTLLKLLPSPEETEFFGDFNANYSLFMIVSLVKAWETFKTRGKYKENFFDLFEMMKNTINEVFKEINNKNADIFHEKLRKFLFFKFDLLKNSHFEFLVENLLKSQEIDMVFREKDAKLLRKFVRNLFEEMIKSDFFENNQEISEKLRFFFVQSQENSFKNSHFFKGFVIELNDFCEFSWKSLENLQVTVCVQEFFEKKQQFSQEISLKKGFDERFFLNFRHDYEEIFAETTVNFIFFQRKIPQNLENSLKSSKIMYLDALGERNIRRLSSFLEITPILDINEVKATKNCLKSVKTLKKLEIRKFAQNKRFLIINEILQKYDFNVILYLNHEKLAKNLVIDEIPKIITVLCQALNENEFLLENGYADIVFFVDFTLKIENLLRNLSKRQDIYGILDGFYCYLVFFRQALHNFNPEILKFVEEKLFFLNNFFENSLFYLNDYKLFLKDCEILRKIDFEEFFSSILRFFVENSTTSCEGSEINPKKYKNIQEYLDILLGKEAKKLSKISKRVKLNLKQNKYEYFYSTIAVLQEFLFLNFI